MHIVPERLLDTTVGFVTYGRNGRWIFGDRFPYQAMPDYIASSSFTAPTILRVMDNAGIERGVIMQGINDNILPDTIAAVQTYPDRLWGAMRLDPLASNLADRVRYFHDMGLTVIKCLTQVRDGMINIYRDNPLDGPIHRAAWKVAEKYGLTLAVDAGFPGTAGYCISALETVAQEYPGLRIVICHLGLPTPGIENRAEENAIWRKMKDLARYPNVWFECSALTDFYKDEAYPFPTVQKLVRDFMEEYGDDKVIWATDMPGTLIESTYKQMINTYELSPLLTEAQKDKLFYDNAIAAYGKREE